MTSTSLTRFIETHFDTWTKAGFISNNIFNQQLSNFFKGIPKHLIPSMTQIHKTIKLYAYKNNFTFKSDVPARTQFGIIKGKKFIPGIIPEQQIIQPTKILFQSDISNLNISIHNNTIIITKK